MNGRWSARIWRLIVVLLGAYLLYAIVIGFPASTANVEEGPPLSQNPSPTPRHPAPALRASRPGGAVSEDADWKGSLRLVVFWAPWCGPCRRELPGLERLAAKSPEGLKVIAVACEYESNEDVFAHTREAGFRHVDLLFDRDGSAMRAYEIRSYPTALLIDRQGIVRYRLNGLRDWDDDDALADIRKVAALSPAAKP